MIVDTFIYNGEAEMLEFRIKILSPVVDYFIVVENAWTHQGQPRERCLTTPTPKVKSFFLDIHADTPYGTEWQNRNAIANCCSEFNDDDLVILSDVDEIPSRESVSKMREKSLPRTCNLEFYYYRLNHRRPETCGLMMTTIAHLREIGGGNLRDLRGNTPIMDAQPSGWHLSYFGGTKAIQKKLSSFCHTEFNKPEFLDDAWLEKCQKEGIALLKCGTQFERVTPDHFPQYFLDAAPKGWWL